MSKISKVLYLEVSEERCSIMKAAEYYFHYNFISVNSLFREGYEQYEEDQIRLRNQLIGENIAEEKMQQYPKISSTIFGVSTLKQKPVIVVEV